MGHHEISKLLRDSTISKFVTRKWIELNDLTSCKYSVNKNIRFETNVLSSDLYNYSDAYIDVKGIIDLLAAATNENDKAWKDFEFKNKAQFSACILKINKTLTGNALIDFDFVRSMYNFLEYSNSYSMTAESFWNYYRGKIIGDNDNSTQAETFKCKIKTIGKTPARPPKPRNPGDADPLAPLPVLSLSL